jgi:copper chaperone
MKQVQFKTTINCGSCIQKVTPVLNQIDTIESWKVDTANPDKILTVEADDDFDAVEMSTELQKIGFQAVEL